MLRSLLVTFTGLTRQTFVRRETRIIQQYCSYSTINHNEQPLTGKEPENSANDIKEAEISSNNYSKTELSSNETKNSTENLQIEKSDHKNLEEELIHFSEKLSDFSDNNSENEVRNAENISENTAKVDFKLPDKQKQTLKFVQTGSSKLGDSESSLKWGETVIQNEAYRDDDPVPVQIKEHKPVYNLAPLVQESETLKKLVALGVDLSVIEKKRYHAQHIIRLDFKKHVVPYLYFFKDQNIEDIGKLVTQYPQIFQHSLENMQIRINYLRSKGFTKEQRTRIISMSPVLCQDVVNTDRDLGVIQKAFKLSGDEVRAAIAQSPRLLRGNLSSLELNISHANEILGFSKSEMKEIFLAYPGFFLKDQRKISEMFDFLYNTMELSHSTLVKHIGVFKMRIHIVKNRHLYLLKVGRAQYDPEKENYVSINTMAFSKDEEFCQNIAKTSHEEYVNFLKCV